VIWYPPAGGLKDDDTEATFTYTLAFKYIKEGQPVAVYSEPISVTLKFAEPPEEQEPEEPVEDKKVTKKVKARKGS